MTQVLVAAAATLVLIDRGVFTAPAAGTGTYVGIPDPEGVIHACCAKSDGSLRVVNSSKKRVNGLKALTWNVKGMPVGCRA